MSTDVGPWSPLSRLGCVSSVACARNDIRPGDDLVPPDDRCGAARGRARAGSRPRGAPGRLPSPSPRAALCGGRERLALDRPARLDVGPWHECWRVRSSRPGWLGAGHAARLRGARAARATRSSSSRSGCCPRSSAVVSARSCSTPRSAAHGRSARAGVGAHVLARGPAALRTYQRAGWRSTTSGRTRHAAGRAARAMAGAGRPTPDSLARRRANVIEAKPDGWWRDREGAARRLIDPLAPFAAGGDDVTVVLDARPARMGGPRGLARGGDRPAAGPRRGRRRDRPSATVDPDRGSIRRRHLRCQARGRARERARRSSARGPSGGGWGSDGRADLLGDHLARRLRRRRGGQVRLVGARPRGV